MLKIKENVDLKELEKFGYDKDDNGYRKDYISEASQKDIDLYYNEYRDSLMDGYFTAGIHIFINNENKQIDVAIDIYSYMEIQTDFLSCDKDYYIQDLIQAGIVEKERDNE